MRLLSAIFFFKFISIIENIPGVFPLEIPTPNIVFSVESDKFSLGTIVEATCSVWGISEAFYNASRMNVTFYVNSYQIGEYTNHETSWRTLNLYTALNMYGANKLVKYPNFSVILQPLDVPQIGSFKCSVTIEFPHPQGGRARFFSNQYNITRTKGQTLLSKSYTFKHENTDKILTWKDILDWIASWILYPIGIIFLIKLFPEFSLNIGRIVINVVVVIVFGCFAMHFAILLYGINR